MAVGQFLKNLGEEIEYKFGNPWRYSDKSLGVVVPILVKDGIDLRERVYITLEEAKDKGVTFKDTGKIDRIIVESSLGTPIFIRSGTALKSGGTQPRAVETSVVIIPQEEKWGDKQKEKEIPVIITRQEIPVRCVYASKGIRSSEKFSYGGDVPLEVRSALISKSGQARVWSEVGSATHRFMAQASYAASGSGFARSGATRSMRMHSDDLVGAMEEVDKFTGDIDKILAKVPLFENQVGAVFLDIKDVVGLEMFDHPRSWESIHKEVEKRLGESVTKEEDKTFFKPDYEQVKPMIFVFLKKLLEGTRTEVGNGITSTVTIKGDGVVGEATTINGKVIHLVGIKTEKTSAKVNDLIRRTASVDDAIRRATSEIRGIRI